MQHALQALVRQEGYRMRLGSVKSASEDSNGVVVSRSNRTAAGWHSRDTFASSAVFWRGKDRRRVERGRWVLRGELRGIIAKLH